jgi:hypothetical protein
LEFQKQVQQWGLLLQGALDVVRQGLLLAGQEYPLPLVRHTVLEFVLLDDEGMAR